MLEFTKVTGIFLLFRKYGNAISQLLYKKASSKWTGESRQCRLKGRIRVYRDAALSVSDSGQTPWVSVKILLVSPS